MNISICHICEIEEESEEQLDINERESFFFFNVCVHLCQLKLN